MTQHPNNNYIFVVEYEDVKPPTCTSPKTTDDTDDILVAYALMLILTRRLGSQSIIHIHKDHMAGQKRTCFEIIRNNASDSYTELSRGGTIPNCERDSNKGR